MTFIGIQKFTQAWLWLIIAGFTCSAGYSVALKVPGYIINNTSDTVFGEIALSKMDHAAGGLYFDGFDLNILSSTVSFKSIGEGAFRDIYPCDIEGFSFTYKKVAYLFKSFTLDHNNMFRNEAKICRFLLLVHRGKISLYRDVEYVHNSAAGAGYDAHYIYWYYLYNASGGLRKAEKDKDIRSVQDLLSVYSVDEDFISTLPRKSTFKDLKEILDKYEHWND